MQRLSFELGERRYIRLLIKSKDCQEFLIVQAGYRVLNRSGEEILTDDCIIDDHLLMAFFAPEDRGIYKIMISYQIGSETLIKVVEVVVV